MDCTEVRLFEGEDFVQDKAKKTSGAANLLFNEKVKSLMRSGRAIAHFGFGESPFPVLDAFVRALQRHAHSNSYLPVQGRPELRECISRFHSKYDKIDLNPDNLIVGPGSKELIFDVINSFKGVIMVPSPSWVTYEQQCNLAGHSPLVLKTDQEKGWKMTAEIILRGLEVLSLSHRNDFKLLIITNPGNPSGTCYNAEELREISKCCRENKILTISDEIYSRLTFSRRHESMIKYYPEGTILTNGLSKWASAGGWRLGYAYFPPTLRPLFDAVCSSASNTYSCAPAPMQDAVAFAMRENEEEIDSYIEDCSFILDLVGNYCAKELESVGVRGPRSEAGFYFMPDFEVIRNGLAKRGIFTGEEMVKIILEEADVALMSSSVFLLPLKDLSVRFCFVCFDGSKALKSYENFKKKGIKLEASNEQGKKFLEENCPNVVHGLQRLKGWVIKQK